MNKLRPIFVLAFLYLLDTIQATPEAKCRTETDSYGLRCILEKISVKSDTGRIKLIGDRATKSVALKDSCVFTISSDICDTFPKIHNLEINNVHAKKIGKHPFVNCLNMKFLWIINNDLTQIEAELDIKTFAHNQQLEFLSLYNNDIKSLSKSGDVFEDLTGLKQLWLSQNCLTDFPKSLMMKLPKNLTTIYVDNNHLTDLDAGSMLKIFPKLLRVHFVNADIPKGRLKQINGIFEGMEIYTDYHVAKHPFKKHCP